MAVQVIIAAPHHLAWIRRFFRDLWKESRIHYPHIDDTDLDALVRLLAADFSAPVPAFRIFLAQLGHSAIGLLGFEVCQRPIGQPTLFAIAHWLYVVPKHRGRGVAQQLIEAGIAWLQDGLVVGETHYPISALELSEEIGNNRWERRGATPVVTRYVLPADQYHRMVAPQAPAKTKRRA